MKKVGYICVFLMLLFLLVKTETVMTAGTEALRLCATAVIPTLFPFFVVSGLMVNLGVVSALGKALSPLSRVLFKTSGKGAVVFVMGVLCGYPTGAKVVADLCNEGSLDKKEGERLLAFCNNSGPLFVIGAVGNGMLQNHTLGVTLYIIHILSAVLTGVVLRSFAKDSSLKPASEIVTCTVGEAVSKSVENAVKSMLNVCGYVVFFGVLCSAIDNVFVVSALEVTQGIQKIIASDISHKLVLLSGAMGFGGICVLLQVESAAAKSRLSLKLYLIGKTLQAFVAMAITFLYVNVVEVAPVFSVGNNHKVAPRNIFFIFLVCLIFVGFRLTKKGQYGIFSLNKLKE